MNSNAMNGNIIGYKMPIWQVIAITVESILGGIAVGTGIFVFVRAARKRKAARPTIRPRTVRTLPNKGNAPMVGTHSSVKGDSALLRDAAEKNFQRKINQIQSTSC